MKKTIAANEVLAVIAVIEQALETGDIDRVRLELRILTENICEEDKDYA